MYIKPTALFTKSNKINSKLVDGLCIFTGKARINSPAQNKRKILIYRIAPDLVSNNGPLLQKQMIKEYRVLITPNIINAALYEKNIVCRNTNADGQKIKEKSNSETYNLASL